MVSGWDKHPGPENDYASGPWSKRAKVALLGAMLVVVFAICWTALT